MIRQGLWIWGGVRGSRGETPEVNCQVHDILSKVLAGNLSSWKLALITWPRWWEPGSPTIHFLFCSLPYSLSGSHRVQPLGMGSQALTPGGEECPPKSFGNSFVWEICLYAHLLTPSFNLHQCGLTNIYFTFWVITHSVTYFAPQIVPVLATGNNFR